MIVSLKVVVESRERDDICSTLGYDERGIQKVKGTNIGSELKL